VTEKTTTPSDAEIEHAASLLRSGGLVAFPTETVYGLGANALDSAAVDRIFDAKGRPPTSPLIVHVSSIHMAQLIVAEWPSDAELLARRFWPGPLTLVLKKHAKISARVTAGLDTVGVRVPAHPVALALLRAAGVPVAAPSANRFGSISPTRAEHVSASLGERVDMILNGGATEVGIESTVLSVASDYPILLRPGMISREQIEAMIGPVSVDSTTPATGGHVSPGMHARHYSPATRLVLVGPRDALPAGHGAYVCISMPRSAGRVIVMPDTPDQYAAALYRTLHELDAEHLDWIAVEIPPDAPAWFAIHDRLMRAASR